MGLVEIICIKSVQCSSALMPCDQPNLLQRSGLSSSRMIHRCLELLGVGCRYYNDWNCANHDLFASTRFYSPPLGCLMLSKTSKPGLDISYGHCAFRRSSRSFLRVEPKHDFCDFREA